MAQSCPTLCDSVDCSLACNTRRLCGGDGQKTEQEGKCVVNQRSAAAGAAGGTGFNPARPTASPACAPAPPRLPNDGTPRGLGPCPLSALPPLVTAPCGCSKRCISQGSLEKQSQYGVQRQTRSFILRLAHTTAMEARKSTVWESARELGTGNASGAFGRGPDGGGGGHGPWCSRRDGVLPSSACSSCLDDAPLNWGGSLAFLRQYRC